MGRAIAALFGTILVAVAVLGGLLIWHIMRRGRLIRERLNPSPHRPTCRTQPGHEVDQSS